MTNNFFINKMKSEYKEIILSDYPEADRIINSGLITDYTAEIYAIQKRYSEIKSGIRTISEAAVILSEEFPKSEHSIRKYIQVGIIK